MADKKKTKLYLYFVGAAVNIASFSSGISFAWPSPELPRLTGDVDPENNPIPYNISVEELSWISSLLNLGAATSPFIAGLVAEQIGRKKSMMICMVPMLAAFLTFSFADKVIYFCIARFLCGVGIGINFTVLPMYLGEISQDFNRGIFGSLMALMVALGSLYTLSVGPYVTVQVFNLINVAPPLLFLILAFFIPESAHYYVAKNMTGSAEQCLEKIRYKEDILGEIKEIKRNIDESRKDKIKIKDILRSKALIKALTISLGLMFFQQFSGITSVFSYMQIIFNATGSELSPQISSIIVGVIQVLSCFLTSVVVDKWGRRLLLLASAIGSAIPMAVLGLYFHLQANSDDVSGIFWLPVTSMVAFVIMYNIGFGTIPYFILGEIFPSNTKPLATATTMSFSSILAFCTAKFFPVVSADLGMAGTFWLFAGFCLLGFAYVWAFVPETKGKSFYEIQMLLGRRG